MANVMLGSPDINFTNSLKAVADMGGGDTDLTTPVNYSSLTAIRARLTAIDAVTYSSANLDTMTINDMVFALRNEDDPKTIADYM
jgi:hypothetical protein